MVDRIGPGRRWHRPPRKVTAVFRASVSASQPARVRGAIASFLAVVLLAATLAIAPGAIGAQAPETIGHTCSNTPATTPSSVVQSGVQGATVGETITLEQVVSFDEGTIFQDIFTRPDGSTFYTCLLYTSDAADE